jgi:hypothetical protein
MFLRKPKHQKPSRELRMAGTYWNGEPAICRRVKVIMGPADPAWWCASMEGETRDAVRIEYRGEVFYIDNQGGFEAEIMGLRGAILGTRATKPGDGWLKVTLGMGGPAYAHASIQNCTEIPPELQPGTIKVSIA